MSEKIAFLAYPVLHIDSQFDQVKIDFYVGRSAQLARMQVFKDGQCVARFYPYVSKDRVLDQIMLEQEFAEVQAGKGVDYTVNIHGEFALKDLN